MIVPFVLLSDQSNIKFFINGRNRNVKSINFFGISITIGYFICCRLKNLSSVFLGIICLSNKKVYNLLWIQAYMNRHFTVFDCQCSLTVICFIYMKHGAVGIKFCTVSTVFKNFYFWSIFFFLRFILCFICFGSLCLLCCFRKNNRTVSTDHKCSA